MGRWRKWDIQTRCFCRHSKRNKAGFQRRASDLAEIDRRFILNVASEKFISILLPHVNDLKNKIQDSGYRNYAHWNNNLVAIRPIVEKYISTDLRSEVSDKAKKRVNEINNLDQLKKQLERILDKSSEACLLLLNEE